MSLVSTNKIEANKYELEVSADAVQFEEAIEKAYRKARKKEKLAKEVEKLGADSLCIKDMAGVLTPEDAKKLFSALKKGTSLPLELQKLHY